MLLFNKFFDQAINLHASDLHLTTKYKPVLRINGELNFTENNNIITSKDFKIFLQDLLTAEQLENFKKNGNLDFAFNYLGMRVRATIFNDINGFGGSFRFISSEIKNIDELGLPLFLKSAVKNHRGLILITGSTGQGKSTSLAALIQEINLTRKAHVITIEDPVEFVFKSEKSLIHQHESSNFSAEIKNILRRDPDVIMIGELRDLDTISSAVTAAETGHLILATLHTQDASQTIERIIDIFPAQQQNQIRLQLAYSLICVCSQQLIPLDNLPGRTLATEILINNPAVRNLIREGKISGLKNSMQTGANFGMHTFEQDCERLINLGLISQETASEYLMK